jgi:c-di-GMP-related signal transduction protein
MKTENFTIGIHAAKEKVWNILWNDSTYRKWTAPFCEGSHIVTDWKENGKALFLDSTKSGMFSVIDKIIPNELISFKHLGEVKNGVEQAPDEKSKQWAGSMEIYKLNVTNGFVTLIVEVDVMEEMEKFIADTFPKALEIVKSLSEEK